MNEILQVKDLKKYYPIHAGMFRKPSSWVKAVDGVSMDIRKGEVLGLVGESGCGKTTLVNTILKLEEPTAGEVIFDGKNLFDLNASTMRQTRRDIQIVFQDPFWSLNPRLLVKDIIAEPLQVHLKLGYDELIKRVEDTLSLVGIPKDGAYKYPHEFSGGQRQRIAIARAIILSPKLLVLDEPTSSIDVLSQSQILVLLNDLKKSLGMTYILISHDLSVVNYMADMISVMYLGKVVEYGPSSEVFKNPRHPYTQALFKAIPDIHAKGIEDIVTLEGNVPSPINPPSGCYFHTRCPYATEECTKVMPQSVTVGENHTVACHLVKPAQV